MSKIIDLSKKLRAMKINGSKSLLLDVDYIEALLQEIQDSNRVDDSKESSPKRPKTIHGGNFR